ncbi:hypothetical protein L208DRAFT_1410427 [Tricholoma matsutake]|nr:hypothetical protein L208DRAFT_1410427 [Tricholoma matsutake 945]
MSHALSCVRLAVSGPCLGVSQAGNYSGKGLSLRLSICGTRLVPPASAESTQMRPLNPTIQLLDPSSQILGSQIMLMLDIADR